MLRGVMASISSTEPRSDTAVILFIVNCISTGTLYTDGWWQFKLPAPCLSNLMQQHVYI